MKGIFFELWKDHYYYTALEDIEFSDPNAGIMFKKFDVFIAHENENLATCGKTRRLTDDELMIKDIIE